MTDEIERIRARVAKYDACGCGNIYAHGGTVEDLRTLLAALDEARTRADRLRKRVHSLIDDAPRLASNAAQVGRREAIQECITAATSVRDGWRERGLLSAPAAAAWCMAIDAVATRLRSMLNAPASTDPATCAHDREVLGGTCSDCAAPIAINGHRPGCHASGLGPPMRIGDGGFTGCGCPPTPDTRT